jgi:hypothetical protein
LVSPHLSLTLMAEVRDGNGPLFEVAGDLEDGQTVDDRVDDEVHQVELRGIQVPAVDPT